VSDLPNIIDRYLAIWNEPDPKTRERAIAEVWSEDCSYTDPLAAVEGRAGVAAVIAGAREQFPGFTFARYGDIDSHHDTARFRWSLTPDGSDEPAVIGFDVAVTAGGQLQHVVGFLDQVPAA
jgi:hypothetical protein